MFFQMLSMVLDVAAGLVAGTCMLRFLMQWQRISFNQPLGRFVFAMTDWLIMPLRKVIPAMTSWDLSSWLGAWLVKLLHFALLWLMGSGQASLVWLPLTSLIGLAQLAVSALSALVLVMAVMSWVNPGSVMHALTNRLCEPFIRPFQRWVPTIGGVDLSALVLLLALQMLGMLLSGWQMAWMR